MINPYSVSVVIPAFNAETTIARAIDSVVAQSHRADEIIVVDDGSQQPLQSVLQPFGDRVTLIRQPNAHAAAARNRGIAAASGAWIAFLDADDYWEPNKLESQVQIARRFPNVDVIAGRYWTECPGEQRSLPAFRLNRWLDRPWTEAGTTAFTIGTLMWTSTVMVRRSLLENESFTSGLEPAEDRDLWVRLADRGTVYLSSQPMATAVLEVNGISRRAISHDCEQMLRVIQRHRPMLGWLATRFWQSYVMYRWAMNEPNVRSSLSRLLNSVWLWPWPYRHHVNTRTLGRIRRLVGCVRSSLPVWKKRTQTATSPIAASNIAGLKVSPSARGER